MLQLHLAVFLFGLAGIFGKLLTVPAVAIVLGRTVLGSATLTGITAATGRIGLLRRDEALRAIPSGLLLALHWVTFFHSIQISSVAVGLLSFATFPVFVAFLDPLFSRGKISRSDLLSAVAVFTGLALVVPNYDFGNALMQGAAWGVVSGLTFALLTIRNRSIVAASDPIIIGLLQNFWAAAALSPFYPPLFSMNGREWLALVFLGVFCTAIAHWLFIYSLRMVRAQIASVTAGLEPVYGILVAALWLEEIPSIREIVGGILILTVVTASSAWERGKIR